MVLLYRASAQTRFYNVRQAEGMAAGRRRPCLMVPHGVVRLTALARDFRVADSFGDDYLSARYPISD